MHEAAMWPHVLVCSVRPAYLAAAQGPWVRLSLTESMFLVHGLQSLQLWGLEGRLDAQAGAQQHTPDASGKGRSGTLHVAAALQASSVAAPTELAPTLTSEYPHAHVLPCCLLHHGLPDALMWVCFALSERQDNGASSGTA